MVFGYFVFVGSISQVGVVITPGGPGQESGTKDQKSRRTRQELMKTIGPGLH